MYICMHIYWYVYMVYGLPRGVFVTSRIDKGLSTVRLLAASPSRLVLITLDCFVVRMVGEMIPLRL